MKATLAFLKKCVGTDEPLTSIYQLSGQQPYVERALCASLPLGEFNLCMDYNRKFSTRGYAGLKLLLPLMKSLLACQEGLWYLEAAFIACRWAVSLTQGGSRDLCDSSSVRFP